MLNLKIKLNGNIVKDENVKITSSVEAAVGSIITIDIIDTQADSTESLYSNPTMLSPETISASFLLNENIFNFIPKAVIDMGKEYVRILHDALSLQEFKNNSFVSLQQLNIPEDDLSYYKNILDLRNCAEVTNHVIHQVVIAFLLKAKNRILLRDYCDYLNFKHVIDRRDIDLYLFDVNIKKLAEAMLKEKEELANNKATCTSCNVNAITKKYISLVEPILNKHDHK